MISLRHTATLVFLFWRAASISTQVAAFAPLVQTESRNNNKLSWQPAAKARMLATTPLAMYFAYTGEKAENPTKGKQKQPQEKKINDEDQESERTRILGSQELLMLPRQYAPNPDVTFPQMTHVCSVILNATPSISVLKQALQEALTAHPLLNARVRGDGEPDEHTDLMKMVRKGEPNPCTFVAPDSHHPISVEDVLQILDAVDDGPEMLASAWQETFLKVLDGNSTDWCNIETGPLWKVEWHRPSGSEQVLDKPCAFVFSLNHAISDQSSLNRFIDQMLRNVASLEEQGRVEPASKVHTEMPLAVEDSVLGEGQRFSDVGPAGFSTKTAMYILGKAAEGFKDPVILPDKFKLDQANNNPFVGALQIMLGKTAGGEDKLSQERRTSLQFKTLDKETTSKLLQQCRANGVSISNALTAAMTMTATDFIGQDKKRNYKVLQSLDLRRFGKKIDQAETIACMAGSHDLMLGPLQDGSGKALQEAPTERRMNQFWDLARTCKRQTEQFVNSDGPEEAVRVFDFAMTISELNNLVHLSAQSKDTKGRAYSAGVTNVGVYERQETFARNDSEERGTLKIQHGRYKIQDIYFATSHVRSGCLFPLSCQTVDGQFMFTFHPMSPVVSDETNAQFADAFVNMLQVVAKGETVRDDEPSEAVSVLKNNALPILAAVVGAFAIASHAGAYASFFNSVMEMKAHTSPQQFWPALNFWIFFAVGHPALQPILWISDVLHGTPGPVVGGLVPALFLVGNAVFIAAFALSQQFRTAINIAMLSAFFAYVGAGLDGTAGLGDFNLALDDNYKGQLVKGCPAYDEVRQPSMDNFDLEKYQGLWYEHKFHDWTQFKEVYDTTLKIKLTDGGLGWVDDFAVKGPAPNAAKLSWDKSPVANGAHYFLFGRVDPNDPPGILRESGFGVEFPNYIVDAIKDPETGEYKESIQFQCLERGGVRVFEGINFMSRNPVMTDEEMAAMHERAEKAGIYPYGASPEQMHLVERRPAEAPEVDNNWQAMWRAIDFDKLLELLTESIEDGGR